MASWPEPAAPRAKRAAVISIGALIAVLVGSAIYFQATRAPAAAQLPVLDPKYAIDYSFTVPTIGWALVTQAMSDSDLFSVYVTTDGSSHWRKQFAASMPYGLATLHFFDSAHGMISILSSPSFMYETSDGGAHWSAITLPRNVVTFVFADPWHGWLETWLGSSGVGFRLFSTSDGGQTWVERNWPAAAAWGVKARYGAEVQFRGNGEGWVGGNASHPTVYLTRDDGVTWQPVSIRVPAGAFKSSVSGVPAYPSYTTEVALLPGGGVMALVIDRAGDVRGFVTVDHGRTWRMLDRPAAGLQYSDYLFTDPTHWWAVRHGARYTTDDAGLSWSVDGTTSFMDTWMYEPHVIDTKHAWAVMSRQQVGTALAMTSNEGLTWHGVNVPQPG